MARAQRQEDPGPDVEQMESVLLSATRSHQLVVVDVPRQLTPAGREALRRADVVLLLAAAQLRGVAAAQQMVTQLQDTCTTLDLLVRLSRPRSLSAETVAEGLGLPLAASLADEPTLPLGAARGEPPGRSGRSPLARSCRSVLATLSLAKAAA
jgi:Flp pilus assembly CpaE family ATPase